MKFRNPLMDRTGPPLTLGTRAARWGAVACLIGLGVMAVPVSDGWRAATAGLPEPEAETVWDGLRQTGWNMAQ